MVISGINGGAFCKDFGTVLLTDVPGSITIGYQIAHPNGNDEFSENYAPDANGQVRINDLGELALCYFTELPFTIEKTSDTSESASYSVIVTANIYNGEQEQLASFAQKFYYSNCKTNIPDPYKYNGFLSRHHRRKIRVDQAQYVAFLKHDQRLCFGVAYLRDNAEQWVEFGLPQVTDDGCLLYRNVGVDVLLALIKDYTQVANLTADELLYYIVYLKSGDQVIDAMQLDVDQTYYTALSHFIYYNCFGVPDTLYFTGKDTRTSEMEATYATIQRKYRKIDTKYNIYHDVNTGYINETLRDCVEDLVHSVKTHLYNERGLGEMVTITDVSFDESRPRTEPINVKLKYRLSAECQRCIDRDMSVDYRIFDHTFGVTFE